MRRLIDYIPHALVPFALLYLFVGVGMAAAQFFPRFIPIRIITVPIRAQVLTTVPAPTYDNTGIAMLAGRVAELERRLDVETAARSASDQQAEAITTVNAQRLSVVETTISIDRQLILAMIGVIVAQLATRFFNIVPKRKE